MTAHERTQMTNKTPAQEALEDYKMRKSSGFNLEGMGAWVWQNESNLIAALKILHAMQSGELHREINVTGDHPCYLHGHNDLLAKLNEIGEQK